QYRELDRLVYGEQKVVVPLGTVATRLRLCLEVYFVPCEFRLDEEERLLGGGRFQLGVVFAATVGGGNESVAGRVFLDRGRGAAHLHGAVLVLRVQRCDRWPDGSVDVVLRRGGKL